MRNIKLILEYDGTSYSGWQSQINGRAIQDVVQQAIDKMTEEPVKLMGASRTDAGVHALGQVACFQTSRAIRSEGFLLGLNGLLPPDIRVKHCEESPLTFHPIFDAKRKTYLYRFDTGKAPSALERDRAWWVGPNLDFAAMEAAAQHLIGEHDFRSFMKADSEAKTTVRRVEEISWVSSRAAARDPVDTSGSFASLRTTTPLSLRPDGLAMTFVANGFLKHMIRNIVGTLVEVGRGRLKSEDVKKILKACDRTQAGPTAPPQGLYLVKVEY